MKRGFSAVNKGDEDAPVSAVNPDDQGDATADRSPKRFRGSPPPDASPQIAQSLAPLNQIVLAQICEQILYLDQGKYFISSEKVDELNKFFDPHRFNELNGMNYHEHLTVGPFEGCSIASFLLWLALQHPMPSEMDETIWDILMLKLTPEDLYVQRDDNGRNLLWLFTQAAVRDLPLRPIIDVLKKRIPHLYTSLFHMAGSTALERLLMENDDEWCRNLVKEAKQDGIDKLMAMLEATHLDEVDQFARALMPPTLFLRELRPFGTPTPSAPPLSDEEKSEHEDGVKVIFEPADVPFIM
ncbi:MAG: hypothetical protein ACHQJ6_02615 [Candidatus Berkiellales bacterium]